MPNVDERRTARMRLSRMRRDDFDDLLRLHRDERVMATLGGVRSVEQTHHFLAGFIAHWERHGFGYWIARAPDEGAFLGRGGLRYVTIDARDEVEVGYAIGAEHWGRGLATELAAESVAVAFGELRLPELVCFTLPTNRASQRVMEKAGFRFERDFTWSGLPHRLYRQSAVEWAARSGRCAN
jgi:ribosomal-protein-alanine N-acetyltransferase